MAIDGKKIQRLYQALIENTWDVVTLVDSTGVIEFLSPSIKVLFGYEPEELVGTLIFDKVHPEDREMAFEILPQILEGKGMPPFIVRFQHKNGSWRFMEVMARLLDQEISGVMLNSRDVTEFEETSYARRLGDASFEAAFNASSNINSVTVVETGEFITVNDGWVRALGWSREEAIGKTAGDLNIWGNASHRSKIISELEKNNGLSSFRAELTKKSGGTCTVLLDATYLTLPVGKHLYFSAIDITEREKTEGMLRQSQRLDAIGHLTGGISHDFNNLLSVIMGHAELAGIDPGNTDQVVESLAAIERASVTGTNLIQQLLSFSKKQSLSPKSIRLCEHILAMRPLLKTTIAKEIELKINCVKDRWYCLIDLYQLDNAILNMTINARDAMPQGGTLEIVVDEHVLSEAEALKLDLTAGDYLSVIISDTGVGMSEHALKHAFDPFYTTKQDSGGIGLGLSMVFGFITQSGGRVFVEPVVIGATISLLLPRALAPPETESNSAT
ncbi:MAG: PAS domain S-box-containing protein [Dinoroseobacter sp.]|jgi:PAS domain S-box-containing protein